jgi:outer membrane murein-binding lipoprotein Lpp
MAKKDQLEKDYENLNRKISQAAEAEMKKIQEKIESLKEEARQIGETVELTLGEKEAKVTKKKD